MRPLPLPLHLIPSLLPSLLIFAPNFIFTLADPIPIALPEAAPIAAPLPRPTAEPQPEAQPNAKAVRQVVYNNAPFSGAVYIVGQGGAQLSPASAAWCPNQAPQGCGNIGVWNWCCPSGNTCAWASSDQSVVGCCPNGVTCSGTVAR
jgi:hypothetical protein